MGPRCSPVPFAPSPLALLWSALSYPCCIQPGAATCPGPHHLPFRHRRALPFTPIHTQALPSQPRAGNCVLQKDGAGTVIPRMIHFGLPDVPSTALLGTAPSTLGQAAILRQARQLLVSHALATSSVSVPLGPPAELFPSRDWKASASQVSTTRRSKGREEPAEQPLTVPPRPPGHLRAIPPFTPPLSPQGALMPSPRSPCSHPQGLWRLPSYSRGSLPRGSGPGCPPLTRHRLRWHSPPSDGRLLHPSSGCCALRKA